ncbi:MAG: PHP-associated domain-containing protein [Candidatus Methanomethylicia archaeon]
MYIDVHVHSSLSDGLYNPSKIVKYSVGRVDGLAFVDHIYNVDSLSLLNKRFKVYLDAKVNDLIVLPGAEFSFDFGHVTVIFPSFKCDFPDRCILDFHQFYDFVKDLGGIIIAAHIFRSSGIGERIYNLKNYFDALEIYPFKTSLDIFPLKIPLIAGSDAHTPWTIGFACTFIHEAKSNIDDIIECIVKGKAIPIIRKSYYLRKILDSPHLLKFFVKRISPRF